MDDFYTEQLIKKQADSKDTLKKVGLIALTVVSVLLVFVTSCDDRDRCADVPQSECGVRVCICKW